MDLCLNYRSTGKSKSSNSKDTCIYILCNISWNDWWSIVLYKNYRIITHFISASYNKKVKQLISGYWKVTGGRILLNHKTSRESAWCCVMLCLGECSVHVIPRVKLKFTWSPCESTHICKLNRPPGYIYTNFNERGWNMKYS